MPGFFAFPSLGSTFLFLPLHFRETIITGMINSRKTSDLTPAAQEKCQQLIDECAKIGITLKIIQTLRDQEYQNYLYQQGRTRHGAVITQCDGIRKKSAHQSGRAFDIVPVNEKGEILWTRNDLFKKIAEISKKIGLRAGYYFKFVDSPHHELF